MDLEDRLKYCKLCQNQRFNFERGMLCGLTNEKPGFDGTCPEYLESARERKTYEENLLAERIKFRGFFDINRYNTNSKLISIALKHIPGQINIKQFELRNYVTTPITTLILIVIIANLKFAYPLRLVAILVFAIVAIIIAIINFNSILKEANSIAIIDEEGITLKGTQKIYWNEVLVIYVNATSAINTKRHEQHLMIELLSRKTPVKLLINKTLGSQFVLTIAEAYRRKSEKIKQDQ
jgi:hypothetical protein